MEADTKKKRGRPRTPAGEMAIVFQRNVNPNNGLRGNMNRYYAASLLLELYGKVEEGNFFLSSRGEIRRQGILEQIGRMYEHGLITKEEAQSLTSQCIQDYEAGRTVKEIEKNLRALRKILQ